MPTYTVTKIDYKANGDIEFWNGTTLETTCQAITAEAVSGMIKTLTTNTGEIIYDQTDLECVFQTLSSGYSVVVQCYIGGYPVSTDYWLSQQTGSGGENMANANLISDGDRTHEWVNQLLRVNNLSELYLIKNVDGLTSGVVFIRMFKSATQHSIFLRAGDLVDNATIQLNLDEDHVASQLELSAKGGTVIDIDSDTHVRFGSTSGLTAPEIRIYNAGNTFYVGLKTTTGINATVTYSLPHTIVTNGYLRTDASGNLSWQTVSGGSGITNPQALNLKTFLR